MTGQTDVASKVHKTDGWKLGDLYDNASFLFFLIISYDIVIY